MSATSHEPAPAKDEPRDEPLENLLPDFAEADIIIRSQDCYHFRVLKIIIIINSPIIGELIRKTLGSPGDSDANPETSLPVINLPESGKILRCLLTFIFPVPPLLPSTPEEIMELLSVAQKYQMATTLTHIRGSISRQNSLPTRLEPAIPIYGLAQKYGLRPEALKTARTLLKYPMTLENFDDKFDVVSSASLYELWKYHERVREILASDLTEFRRSHARGTIRGLCCVERSSSQIPSWLDQYIESIGKSPNLFDFAELNVAMVRHTNEMDDESADQPDCECASIPSSTMREFWGALASVVHDALEKASTVDVQSCSAT